MRQGVGGLYALAGVEDEHLLKEVDGWRGVSEGTHAGWMGGELSGCTFWAGVLEFVY